MEEHRHKIVSIFYSYAPEDENLQNELAKHLSGLKHEGLITDYYDRKIVEEKDWAYTNNQHLNSASIILLLISANFLNSDPY